MTPPDGTLIAAVVVLIAAMALTIFGLCEHIAGLNARLAALEPAPYRPFTILDPEPVELAEPEPLAPPFLRWPDPLPEAFNTALAPLWPDPPPPVFARQPAPTLTQMVAAGWDEWTYGRDTREMAAIA